MYPRYLLFVSSSAICGKGNSWYMVKFCAHSLHYINSLYPGKFDCDIKCENMNTSWRFISWEFNWNLPWYEPLWWQVNIGSGDDLVRAIPDSKVHGANMGSTWVLSAPDWPHVGPWTLLSETTWSSVDRDLRCRKTSIGHNELIHLCVAREILEWRIWAQWYLESLANWLFVQ